jgi:hypothetical protein
MKARTRVRPSLEALEQRWCPSVTASVRGGSLVVSGAATNAGDTIQITQTAANTFQVKDGATVVGTLSGATKDVVVNLGAASDKVALDLGGQAAPRNVSINLGGGDNQLSVVNGTIDGHLSITGGRGVDTVTLGDGTSTLQINRNTGVHLDGSATDSLTVSNKVTAKGNFEALFVNNVTLAAGSAFEKNVGIVGGRGGNTAAVAGRIDGNLGFTGSNAADSFTLSGTVGKSLGVITFGGNDTVSVGGTVSGHLFVAAGAGNDAITLSGVVGKTTTVFADGGDDTLTATATAQLQGNAFISMGAGTDSVTLNDAATITKLLASGGAGTDTFTGNKTRSGLTLVSFEA